MIKVALLQLYDACSYPLFIAHLFPCLHNHLCVNTLSLYAQNSRISHTLAVSYSNPLVPNYTAWEWAWVAS